MSERESRNLNIVADENIPALEEYFADLGTITRLPGRSLNREQLRQADILLVRSVTQVDAALLAETSVRFVGSCTIGTDHLDIGWLEQNSIDWSAAPGCNANSVVEYVFCALAALGVDWAPQRDKERCSFGIVGCGNVGGLLQKRLHALNISCAVYDPWLPDNPDAGSLHQVLQQDVICLHAPLVMGGPHPSFHLLGKEELALIKDGAVLISAGRGAVVDNSALLQLLNSGKKIHTVLDVWEKEPDINIELLQRVDLGTPHIAGYSLDGKLAGTRMIREALNQFLSLPVGAAAGRDHSSSERRALSRPAAAPTSASGFAAAADLLLQIYDPRQDDKRLRAAAAGELPMAQAFDTLRREYPERLEFSHYRIEHDRSALSDFERRQLYTLGLQ